MARMRRPARWAGGASSLSTGLAWAPVGPVAAVEPQVLTRWFPEALVQPIPQSKMLDIILYSREQARPEDNTGR